MSQLPLSLSRRLARGAAALAVAAAFLTACGGEDSAADQASSGSGASGGGESITATEADFSITLDEDSLTAGTYDITVVNDGDATHDLVVEKDGEDIGKTDTIAPEESTTLTVTLESGDYVFYCSIGNHRAMGMEVTVTVT